MARPVFLWESLVLGVFGAVASVVVGAMAAGVLNSANIQVQQFLTHSPIQSLAQLAYAQSAIISFGDVNYAIALLSLLCIPLVFLIGRRKDAVKPAHIDLDMG